MHRFSNYVIAYHGCDKKTQEYVVNGGVFKKSINSYDWLGNGIYFWENDEQRALEWAKELKKRGKISNPAVVGAIIDMGNCLDLTQRDSVELLKVGYNLLQLRSDLSGIKIPKNHTINRFGDILERDLDCAVIQQIHSWVEYEGLDKYDTVRGVFTEGGEVYPGAGFVNKTHIQICVVNPNRIIGCFLPRANPR